MTNRFVVLALIFFSVGLNAAAQLFLRVAMRTGLPANASVVSFAIDVTLRPGVLAGLFCYGLSLITWIYVLSKVEASYAYPFLALGFIIVAIAGALLLGESFTARKIIGTLIIAAGVAVLAGR